MADSMHVQLLRKSRPLFTLPKPGEVLVKGPSVISEYYKRDDLNNDTDIFGKDGWFHTGDVGQWNADGTLSLIDR